MIEELIIFGVATIALTAGTLAAIYVAGRARRKARRQKLDELHHRKMQILDELKKELEVEALEKQKSDNILDVYDIQEVSNDQIGNVFVVGNVTDGGSADSVG